MINVWPVGVFGCVQILSPDQSLASGLLCANTHTLRIIFTASRHADDFVP